MDGGVWGIVVSLSTEKIKARRYAKTCAGAEFALNKILNPPNDVSALPRFARETVSTLRKKGIGEDKGMAPLPPFFWNVLKKMQVTSGQQPSDASAVASST